MLTVTQTPSLPKIDSVRLSEYILTQVQQFGVVSHLKLQKLLYYVQAYHLAYFDTEVIDDQFQAWVHGPVSRKIYDMLKDYSVLHGSVTYKQEPGETHPVEYVSSALMQEQIELINDILNEYGPMTAYALECQTHAESPWIEARRGYGAADRCEVGIKNESMKVFYKQFLYGQVQD